MEPPWILLKSTSWLPKDEWSTLLGAVVENFWAPTDSSVPSEPLTYNKGRKFVENGFRDFVLSKNDGRGKAAELKLKGLAGLNWKGGVDENFDLSGKKIRYIKLRQLPEFWGAIKEDPDFKQKVPQWLGSWWHMGSKTPVCLITGLFICESVTVESSTAKERERGASLEAPIGTAASAAAASQGFLLPSDGTGNLEANFSLPKNQHQVFNAEHEGSSIFALQLKVISSKMFDKKMLKLEGKSPKAPAHRQMGENEKIPSVASLVLEDMDDENIASSKVEDVPSGQKAT